MRSLPLFHDIAGHTVLVLGDAEATNARRRLVERAGGLVVGDVEQAVAQGARLAFVAWADGGRAQADAARLRERGFLVNVADRPDLCDFTMPSLLERGDVLLAIGTGGLSAGLAKALRLRLDGLVPARLGQLAQALGGLREAMRRRWPDAGERRHALDMALSEGGVLDPLDEGSADRVDAWLAGAGERAIGEEVSIVLRSDDPDDLTLREARWLGRADTILCDAARTPHAILARARADAARLPLDAGNGTRPGLTVTIRLP